MPTTATTPPPESTRDRIIREAARLFAESGIKATTVARIESAVGLRPGSGGVHRHFATKDDLVVAVLDSLYEHSDSKIAEGTSLAPPPLEDLGEFLRSAGMFILREADAMRTLFLIGAREGASLFTRYPQYRQRTFSALLAPIADDLRALAERRGTDVDADVAAFLFVAPLLYHRSLEWLTGESALRLPDERIVDEWARQQEILLAGDD